MLTDFIDAPHVLSRLQSGLSGEYLDEFTIWLKKRGYSRTSIRLFIWGIEPFIDWATSNNLPIQALNTTALEAYRMHSENSGTLHHTRGKVKASFLGARNFVNFLIQSGVVEAVNEQEPAHHPLLEEFWEWMRSCRGVRESTLSGYAAVIEDLFDALGSSPQDYDARSLREFVLDRASKHGIANAKATVTATRMFLRFLIATERCAVGLVGSVPVIANWKRSSLPRYLSASDVDRLIVSCDDRTITALRDKAIMLLASRLGLRAGDIAGMVFEDIDWEGGRLRVSGKSRREVWLPIPQDAGEAIIGYLEHERPEGEGRHVFVKAIAPSGSMSSELVSTVVRRAMDRAGIDSPSRGLHVLRHSAATSMLREGATLHQIGTVLRHASIETTFVYAKVDIDLLSMVVSPWPVRLEPSVPNTRVSNREATLPTERSQEVTP